MAYYLLKLEEYNDFDFTKLIIGKKISIDDTLSKYYIYYQENENSEPKEIYIKLPKLRVIYKLGNSKFNQENIPIYPNYDSTNKFIKFIKNFENHIKTHFTKLNNIEFINLIKKKNNLNLFKINTDDKIKISSNNNLYKKISDFQLNGEIEIVSKISYIWNKNDLKLGLSSLMYQIKYYCLPYELNIDFIDTDDNKEKINNSKMVPPSVSSIIVSSKINSNNENNEYTTSSKFIPSIMDLNSAINKLKKNTDTNEKTSPVNLDKPKFVPSIMDLNSAISKLKKNTDANEKTNSPIDKPKFVPSIMDLNSAINKLKKI
jgi:hypothetical protein